MKQAGSLVAPDRLRFDFTHFEPMHHEQILEVERICNNIIMSDLPVYAYETSLTSAREAGVLALFGEKYGEFVRVIETGTFSKELCGGTHVGNTSEIGLFKIVQETSIGANTRRLEAVTSIEAYEYMSRMEEELRETARFLKVPPLDVSERVAKMQARLDELEGMRKRRMKAAAEGSVADFMERAIQLDGYKLIVADLGESVVQGMREMWDIVKQRSGGVRLPSCSSRAIPKVAIRSCWRLETPAPSRRASMPRTSSRTSPRSSAVVAAASRQWHRQAERTLTAFPRLSIRQRSSSASRPVSMCMRVMGLDIGEKRIGVAIADTATGIAVPLRVMDAHDVLGNTRSWRALVQDNEPDMLVCGLPKTMRGDTGGQARRVRDCAERIAQACGLPLEFADERLSSAEAKRLLPRAGVVGTRDAGQGRQRRCLALSRDVDRPQRRGQDGGTMTQGQHYATSSYTEKRKSKSRKRTLIIALIAIAIIAVIGFVAAESLWRQDRPGQARCRNRGRHPRGRLDRQDRLDSRR